MAIDKIAKVIRILNDDSQEEVAAAIGCSRSTLSKKENGKSEYTLNEIIAYSNRYNVPVEVLVNGNETVEKIRHLLRA